MSVLHTGMWLAAMGLLSAAACSTASSDCEKLGTCNPLPAGSGGATTATGGAASGSAGAGTGGEPESGGATPTGGGGSGGSEGLPNGATCSSPAQCDSGFCSGDVCCSMACDALCEICSGDGMGCATAPMGTACDVDQNVNEVCDDSGACKLASGAPCQSNPECASGNCMGGNPKTCQ